MLENDTQINGTNPAEVYMEVPRSLSFHSDILACIGHSNQDKTVL